MYAIIRAGGKQAKVREGDVIDVERVKSGSETLTFTPLLLVADDGSVVADRDTLAKATVTAEVVGEHRGTKIEVFTYKNKSGSRRRQGHRQTYTTIKVTEISGGAKKKTAPKKAAPKKAAPKKAAPKKAAPEAADDVASEDAVETIEEA